MNIDLFLQVFLMILLILSALSKFLTIQEFQATIHGLGFGQYLSKFLAIIVPTGEFIIALSLAFSSLVFSGLISLILLLLIFLFVTIYALYTKKKIKCNCFGGLTNEEFGMNTIVHILLFFLLDTYLLLNAPSKNILDYPLNDLINTSFSSIGIVMLYVLGSTFYDYKKL